MRLSKQPVEVASTKKWLAPKVSSDWIQLRGISTSTTETHGCITNSARPHDVPWRYSEELGLHLIAVFFDPIAFASRAPGVQHRSAWRVGQKLEVRREACAVVLNLNWVNEPNGIWF
jgi:hypothetical protein